MIHRAWLVACWLILALPVSSVAEFSYSLATRYSLSSATAGALQISPDLKWLVASDDGSLRVLDIEDPEHPDEHSVLPLSGKEVTAVAFSQDSALLVVVDLSGDINAFAVPGFKRTFRIAGAHRGGATAVGFTGDGAYVVSGGRRGEMKVWAKDGSQFAVVDPRVGHDREVLFIGSVDPNRTVVSVGKDRKVLVWNVDTQKIVRATEVDSDVMSAALGVNGKVLAVGVQKLRGSTFVGVAAPGSTTGRVGVGVEVGGVTVGGKEISKDPTVNSQTAAAVDKVQMIDTQTGVLLRELEGQRQDLDAVAVTPDGAFVASGGSGRSATIWRTSSGERIAAIPFDAPLADIEFSRDGKLLVATSTDGDMALFRLSGVSPAPMDPSQAPAIVIIITSPVGTSAQIAGERTLSVGSVATTSLRVTGRVKSEVPLKRILLRGDELSSVVAEGPTDYLFSGTVSLESPGVHEIELIAEDQAGHLHKEKLRVERTANAKPPDIVPGRRLALIVGVSDYADDSIDLGFADDDAEALRAELTAASLGPAAFRPEDVRLLVNEEATVANINVGLRDFLQKARENDFVLFFFAGHGVPDPNRLQDYYLMAHDSDPANVAGTGLLMRHVREAISAIPARDILILTDACHSAGMSAPASFRSLTVNPIHQAFLEKLQHSSGGLAILTASEAAQYSQESDRWDGHGVFSWALLKALRGEGDANGDRIVDLGEVMEYVRDIVKRETGARQIPAIGPTNFDRKMPLTLLNSDAPR